MLDIKFQVRNVELKDITRKYIIERLQKFERLIPNYENLTISIDKVSKSKLKNNINKVDITIKMPHAFIKVENEGSNINTLIDKLLPPLQKKILRYKSQEERWVKHKEWKTVQLDKNVQGEEEIAVNTTLNNFEPNIKRKYYQDDSPIHPIEAIERMELLGSQQFLFKNIENNKYAIIVKDKASGYELIQPK